ncbi:MAG TPA: hypothetical protein VHF05_03350 [Candidatus Paceibacterota bacterium]|nr:hypothetical protein [Candidatus Paceibacterota bacterium]
MDELEDNRPAELHRHVHTRLKLRLVFYFLISIVLVMLVALHIIVDQVNFLFPAIAIVIGLGVGIILSRTSHITWDHGAQKVISRFDILGGIILALYGVFEIFKEEIVEEFVHGPAVVATSLALLTGIMIGRVIGIGGKIVRVLDEQNIG